MFGQMKDMWKMQKQARQMQKKMKEIEVVGHSKDEMVKVHMNGIHEITHVTIDPQIVTEGNFDLIAKNVMQASKEANKKLRKEMASNMNLDEIKGMLGGGQ